MNYAISNVRSEDVLLYLRIQDFFLQDFKYDTCIDFFFQFLKYFNKEFYDELSSEMAAYHMAEY